MEMMPSINVVLTPESILRRQLNAEVINEVTPYTSGAKLKPATSKGERVSIRVNCSKIERVSGPNYGQRVRLPQTVENGELEYIGAQTSDQTGRTKPDNDNRKYAYLFSPFYGTPILNYRTNRYTTGGVLEPVLYEALGVLKEIEPEIEILRNISLPVKNRTYGYKPDIAIVWRKKNVFLDIEIDEPYDIVSRKPIHYLGCRDKIRNAYFMDNGWFVCRFAEEQVAKNCDGVVNVIGNVVWAISDDDRFCNIDKNAEEIDDIVRWNYSEAEKLALENYREKYLGIENIIIPKDVTAMSLSDLESDDKTDSEIPADDIFSDRYETIRNDILRECGGHKYILLTIKSKCYDYVAYADQIKFGREDGAFGISLYDVVEKKDIFLCYQEIDNYKGMDDLIKQCVTDENANKDEIMRDAILNSNPVTIKYDTGGRGDVRERTVLYLTLWYEFLNDADNRSKYSILELLTEANRLKYLSLAKDGGHGFVSGYCTLRHDIRTFACDSRMESISVLNCRKNPCEIEVSDIWNVLENGYAYMAIHMYNELSSCQKQDLYHLGNYANALVMQNRIGEAIDVYSSVDPCRHMRNGVLWKNVCFEDIDYFISKEMYKENFEKVRLLLKNLGW
jgi:hypothetical protein